MNKINWKQKLSSRKFWAAVTGVVSALLVLFNLDSMSIEKIIALVSAEGVLVSYILSEGSVDKSALKGDNKNEH